MKKSNNAEEFLHYFNKIETHLKDEYNYSKTDGFKRVIRNIDKDNKNEIVSMNIRLLESYAELRNAIVHTEGIDYVIADPRIEAVENIKEIEKLISYPPRVMPKFQMDVLSFKSSDSIFDVINEMFENDFSQIPIVDEDRFVGLLNSNTVTRWFGATANKEIDSDGSTIITDTKIKDVLEYEETDKNYKFINRNTFLHDAIASFEKDKTLEALLITHNGEKSEKLLGIITIWDLFEINKVLLMNE